jgi:hypothetical protein
VVIAAPALAQPARLPYDAPTSINGVEVACTGIGVTARNDPRWNEFPLKIEVTGAEGQFLGNVAIVIERAQEPIVELTCGGPWIMARLEPGPYSATATFEGTNATGTVNVPAAGQARLILRFPEMGGAVSPEHVPSPG